MRGWDVAEKKALIGDRAGEDDQRRAADGHPADMAETFGDPTYVATDVAVPHPGRGGRARPRRSPRRSPARSPSSRASPAATRSCVPARRSRIDGLGAPFDGKYTITTSRHRFDPTTGYTTAFSVTGAQDRSLYGLASGGGARRAAAPGVGRSPRSATSTTRSKRAG